MAVLTTIPREAIKGTGGIQYALVGDFASIATSVDTSTGLATINTDTSTYWVKYIPRKESSNFTETATGTPASGITSYNQVLTLVFAYNQTAKRNQLKVLGQSELKAVVVDRNGNGWLLGNEFGLDLTSGTLTSGTAPTDMNGMTVILSGNEREPMAVVDASTLLNITPA